MIMFIILLLIGLCIAGFVLSIIAISKKQSSPAHLFEFSFGSLKQPWPLASKVQQTIGSFFVPQNGYLKDLTISGNILSNSFSTNNYYSFTVILLSSTLPFPDYKATTSLTTNGNIISSIYQINQEKIEVKIGSHIQVLLEVEFNTDQPIIECIVSCTFVS